MFFGKKIELDWKQYTGNDSLNLGTQIFDFTDVRAEIAEFLDLYSKRPVKGNQLGMKSTHLFWTYFVLKKLQPRYIIESGVYKGQGSWLMSEVCPKSKIFSIDPQLEQRIYINDNITYFTKDFSEVDWTAYCNPEETFCFFDDHQNAYDRLIQMKWMGFKDAMFEDNYPINKGDCYSIKHVLTECGFHDGNKVYVSPNSVHSKLFKQNVESYTTFPPLFKNRKTRWGDEWNNEKYLIDTPILDEEEREKYSIIDYESGEYTWICFVRLNK